MHTFIDALGSVVLHNTVSVFVPPIDNAITEVDPDAIQKMKDRNKATYEGYHKNFEDYYSKAKKTKYAETEEELGAKAARYNQEIAETENELIERLGGLRKRSLILQSRNDPPVITIGKGTKFEENITLDVATINRVTDVEKILKMKEPRWLLKQVEHIPWQDLTPAQRELARDYHIRKELTKVVSKAVEDPGVRKLYDLLREPSKFMKEEFMSPARENDPIGMKLDTKERLLDRILYNELRGSDVLVDLDAE
jgi:hypothetical protein